LPTLKLKCHYIIDKRFFDIEIKEKSVYNYFDMTIFPVSCQQLRQGLNRMNSELMIRRGELYYANLSPVIGSEQGGVRPVLIVQNDIGNKHSPTVIAAAVTSQLNKARLPTHIELTQATGLTRDSVLLLEQIRTLDKTRLQERIGLVNDETMARVNNALLISLGFHV
jgi:mRNA interferase MazF